MSDSGRPFFGRLLAGMRSGESAPMVALILLLAASMALLYLVFGNGDAEDSGGTAEGATVAAETSSDENEFAEIVSADSSWIRGQASLVAYGAYLVVANRAEDLAIAYQEARDREVARQERLADLARKEARAAARHRALAAYREALRQARLERLRQKRELARRRQEIKERIARLREKYKVEPGEECQIPEVQKYFDCSTGYPF